MKRPLVNFAQMDREKGKKQLAALSKEQLLHDCGAITDEGITYAALILFGKNSSIIRYLPQAEIILSTALPRLRGLLIREKSLRPDFLHAMIKSGNSSIYAMTNNITRKDFLYLILQHSMNES